MLLTYGLAIMINGGTIVKPVTIMSI